MSHDELAAGDDRLSDPTELGPTNTGTKTRRVKLTMGELDPDEQSTPNWSSDQSRGVPTSADGLVGAALGRYKLTALISRGGMGCVYRGFDTLLEREVAVKVLSTARSVGDELRRGFLHEARVVGRVNHSGLVAVYEVGQARGVNYIVMEYAHRGSLGDLLRGTRGLSWREATRVTLEVCEALWALHRAGVVHRDVKPGNLLMFQDGAVKLADFGLAKVQGAEEAGGEVVGSPHFMSPEQCRGLPTDGRSDIYSLGATFFTMLTGKRPFPESRTPAEVLYAHCQGPVPDPRAVRSDLPAECARVVRRAMAKDPTDRYGSAGEMAADLHSALSVHAGPAESATCSTTWLRSGLASPPAGPSVAVVPFESDGSAEHESFASALTEEVTTRLGQFRDLFVIARSTMRRYSGKQDTFRVGQGVGARYLVVGSVRASETGMRVTASMVDAHSGAQCWGKSYRVDTAASNPLRLQEEITSRLVGALALPCGVISRLGRAEMRRRPLNEFVQYDAVLKYHQYLGRPAAKAHGPTLALLQRAVEADPNYATAWAALARLHLDVYRLGFGPADGALVRAARCAESALESDPNDALAHLAMAGVRYHRRESGGFTRAAALALDLNPDHAEVLAWVGSYYALGGDLRGAASLGKKAVAACPLEAPGWYHLPRLLSAAGVGDWAKAWEACKHFDAAAPAWSPLLRAAALLNCGRRDEARQAWRALCAQAPKLVARLDDHFDRWNFPAALRRQLARAKADLASA